MAAGYEAFVEVLPDFSKLKSTANSQLTGILGGAGTAGGLAAGQGMNSGILGSIPKIAGPLLAAVAALGIGRLIGESIGNGIRFGIDGIDLASDLSETKSAIQQVFGGASKDIEAFASTANKSLGQTQQEALSAAQTFGVFASSAGLVDKPLADFSTGLVTLSGDLASFYNTSPQEAIDAIGAGLRGEAEPLRKYGVLLDDATLKSRALALGLYDGSGALTAQQRILAAQAEIFAQTGIAQGDFERTSGGLANQQKILAASFQDAQTSLGTALMPTMLLFTQLANDTLIPMLNDLVAQVGPELATALKDSAPAFVELVNAIAPLIPDLVKLSVDLLPAVLTLMKLWAEDTSGTVGAISSLFALIGGDISVEEFLGRVSALSGAFGTLVGWAATAGAAVGQWGFDTRAAIGNIGATVVGAVSGFGTLLVSSGRALIQGFIDGIGQMFTPVRNAVTGLLDYVAGFFPHSPAQHGPFSGSGWTAVGDAGKALAGQFAGGFNTEPSLDLASIGVGSLGAISGRTVSSSGGASGGGATRPIYADGSLFGWIKELANGEAQLVVAGYDNAQNETTSRGWRA